MKLHKTINSSIKRNAAQSRTYSNAQFGSKYSSFMEALAIDHLVTGLQPRIKTPAGHVWSDLVGSGGISITTTSHPMLENGNVGDLIVTGSKDGIELFENVLNKYATFEGMDTRELEVKIEYHDELNPAMWDRDGEVNTLKSNVQAALNKAAQAFIAFLKVPKVEIKDITITGSGANYNWTKSSDIDIHVVVDLGQAEQEYGSIVKEYFDAKKNVWNELHDISVKGIPVEFYVQDENEKHHSTGIYSLKDTEWVTVPKHEAPDVDDSAVKQKAQSMMRMIDAALESNKASVIETVMDKIKVMRQSGLEEAGEFSVENLAFKILRNTGYLEKLTTVKTKTFDRDLSVEDEEWTYLQDQMAKLPVRQPYMHY